MQLHPAVQELKEVIEGDPTLYMYFHQMFEDEPDVPIPPDSGDTKITSFEEMLENMSHLIGTAPIYTKHQMVGLPICAMLTYPMAVKAGQAAFSSKKVNDALMKVLNAWCQYLDSPESRYVLNDSPEGWFCKEALAETKLDQFVYDDTKPYWGFTSWNDFFTRKFKPGLRPVAYPDDDSAIISPCESAPFAIANDVKELSGFWLKSVQSYSLRHMLNENFVDRFVGGTVYQAMLSAHKYHRWHSPVSGTVKKVENISGTYYTELDGFDSNPQVSSQAYLTHTATRALIFIEADNPEIGMVAMVMVGMGEVSSCKITVTDGQKLNKGDEVGFFQFGGSTFALVFEPEVIKEFVLKAIPQGEFGTKSSDVEVNSLLARSK